MEGQAWIFENATGDRLELCHQHTPEGMLLVVTGDSSPRSYFFRTLDALTDFQTDMESFLLRTGWKFVSFSPDRRSGRDRRQWPRITERRRWWTDNPTSLAPSSGKRPPRR